MKLSRNGRLLLACAVSIAMLLGVSACGGGTIGYLWVLAGQGASNTQGNVITGYKVDDYTGNLTEMPKSPFNAGSATTGAPQYGVVLSGGRYLYTLNLNDKTNAIIQFSVGGDGTLAIQQNTPTVGGSPVWMDISGNYLYVLDSVSPAGSTPCTSPTNAYSAGTAVPPCGSVEVFQITADTGLLTPVLNTSIKVNGVAINYFPVGPNPKRIKVLGSNVVVLNGDNTATIFGTSGSQLTTSANSLQILDQSGVLNYTSLTTGGSYLYLTDGTNNRINQYTLSSGVLQPTAGSPYTNSVSNTTPVYTLTAVDGTNQFVYVLNSGTTTNTQATGTISIFQVDSSNGRLNPLSGLNSQSTVGSFPVCMTTDTSFRYLYTSNADGTVTGFQRRQGIGTLQQLRHGSQFTASGKPTCLVYSGITS